MSTAVPAAVEAPVRKFSRMTVAYLGLVLFTIIYYARPNDWIPGATYLPFAMVAALLALAGFFVNVMIAGPRVLKFPLEMKLLVVLFFHLCLTIPFASWRGGAFDIVFNKFSKVVLITLLVVAAVNTWPRLRRLLFIQAAALTLMSALVAGGFGSAVQGTTLQRTGGVVGGAFGNPNDFAFAVGIAFPFCLALMLNSRNILKKAFWAAAMALMAYSILLSFSRSGMLVFVAAVATAVFQYGFRGKRRYLIVLAIVGGMVLLWVGASAGYMDRLATIINPGEDPTGSAQARTELLRKSIAATLENPIFGVGPYNFPAYSGFWKVAHNTYTALSAEGGIPALILFLIILWRSFRNLNQVQASVPAESELWIFAIALRASLTGYVVGAFFADTPYQHFTYFLLAYTSCLYLIVKDPGELVSGKQTVDGPLAARATQALKRA